MTLEASNAWLEMKKFVGITHLIKQLLQERIVHSLYKYAKGLVHSQYEIIS
jgi:hypothetical protein